MGFSFGTVALVIFLRRKATCRTEQQVSDTHFQECNRLGLSVLRVKVAANTRQPASILKAKLYHLRQKVTPNVVSGVHPAEHCGIAGAENEPRRIGTQGDYLIAHRPPTVKALKLANIVKITKTP